MLPCIFCNPISFVFFLQKLSTAINFPPPIKRARPKAGYTPFAMKTCQPEAFVYKNITGKQPVEFTGGNVSKSVMWKAGSLTTKARTCCAISPTQFRLYKYRSRGSDIVAYILFEYIVWIYWILRQVLLLPHTNC